MRIITATWFYPSERMGGAEQQTLLLAHGLANLGHDVIFLGANSGEEGEFTDGDVKVVKVPGRHTVGWKQHRQLLTKAIRDNTPDICYVRVFDELATIMPPCKQAGVPIVSMSVHWLQTSPILLGHHPRETIGHLRSMNTLFHLLSFLSIRSSAAHVCNSRALQQRIQRWFLRKPIGMIYNGSPVPPLQDAYKESTGQVIWVNNLKRFKRPEIFIELARCLPQYRFIMIGRMYGGRYGRKLDKAIQQAPSNLEYLGPMTIDQVNVKIGQSDLLLYTSMPVEGFGNSFIQAWLRQVPTISLSFKLDGILERENIGRCSRNFEQLITDVKELMEDESMRLEMGQRAREYAVSNHSAEMMVSEYETLFRDIVHNSKVQTAREMKAIQSQS